MADSRPCDSDTEGSPLLLSPGMEGDFLISPVICCYPATVMICRNGFWRHLGEGLPQVNGQTKVDEDFSWITWDGISGSPNDFEPLLEIPS